jgi:4-hydroxybenzoate polyprenyltransferase
MKAYLRLIRFPNLLIIILTQVLVRHALFSTFYSMSDIQLQMPELDFILLVLTTVLIAAAGYIINDILDQGIDNINDPNRNIIGKIVSERIAYIIYYTINVAAVLIGFYLGYRVGKIQLGIIFLIIATMLYYYSLKYKYLPLWGNLVVSLLSFMVIGIVWLFEFYMLKMDPLAFTEIETNQKFINILVLSYAGFAFLVSLGREIIKDLQDIEGDRRSGCRTFPIVFGIGAARVLAIIFILVTMACLGYFQHLLFSNEFRITGLYLFLIQGLLLIAILLSLGKPQPKIFGRASTALKITMIAGILSMVFFQFS